MFYLALAVLAVSVLGGLYLLSEWFRHKGRHPFMLYWGLGLLIVDWFTFPTVLVAAERHLVYASFNPFFSVSMPLGFLGYVLVYLGMRSIARLPITKKTYALLFAWLLAAAVLYAFEFGGGIVPAGPDLLIAIAFFLVPVQLLSLRALWVAWRSNEVLTGRLARTGLVALAGSVLTVLARYAYVIEKALVYPPQFAPILIRTSVPYILSQILGIVLLLSGFLFVHKRIPSQRPASAGAQYVP